MERFHSCRMTEPYNYLCHCSHCVCHLELLSTPVYAPCLIVVLSSHLLSKCGMPQCGECICDFSSEELENKPLSAIKTKPYLCTAEELHSISVMQVEGLFYVNDFLKKLMYDELKHHSASQGWSPGRRQLDR